MAKRTMTIWWVAGSIVMFGGFFAAPMVSIATNPGNPSTVRPEHRLLFWPCL